jgi:carbonic anhydrase/acetyltransferase-like protein (isoleucine patch superfamily)
MIHNSVITDFCSKEYRPEVDSSAFVHPLAAVIGHVRLGKRVMVAPFAAVRGDEGHPILVGDESNVQDGVVIHALETERHGEPVSANLVEIEGERYAVHVGRRVSLAHQVQVHGPASVGDDTFVGMKSLVFRAKVGKGCVVEPGAILMGVTVGEGRVVPAGTVLRSQSDADNLPLVDADYPLKDINQGVVRVNTRLAEGYNRAGIASRGHAY